MISTAVRTSRSRAAAVDVGAPAPAAPARRPRRRRHYAGYLFIAPLLFGIAAFQLYPIGITAWASFTQWDGLGAPRFVGLANYVRLLTDDPVFLIVVRNTLLFMVGAIPLTMIVALGLAELTRRNLRGMVFFRLAFFFPYVASQVAIAFVWFRLLSGETGSINRTLAVVGIEGKDWLVETPWPLVAVIVVSVWQTVGYPMIILIAGMQAIPDSLYEAAELDGASSWRKFRSVTLPLLTPSLFFVSISQFIATFQVFAVVYVMTGGGPGNETNVYMLHLFKTAFGSGNVGYAAAMAWVLFLVIGLLTAIQWQLQKRWVFYG